MNCPKCNYSNVVEARFCANCGTDLLEAKGPTTPHYPEPPKPKASGCSGIWIAVAGGCFVFLIIAGIIAAIAIPNLLNSMHRDKQKRTIADMNLIADALEDYADWNLEYPEGKSIAELKSVLVPDYLKTFPEKDAWGNQFQYNALFYKNEKFPTGYLLVSFGKDGVADAKTYYKGTRTTSFNNDIVLSNGTFWQYPENFQSQP
jgi:type II secretory pathway pseudopilin PulG